MTRTVVIPLGVATALAACSDDTYIATNEAPPGSGATSAGGTSGTGGDDAGGTGGSAAGAGGVSGASGQAGAAGSPATGGTGGSASCTPNTKEKVGTCAKCGSVYRTCDASGTWGAPVCEGQGDCEPGAKSTSGCSDPCAEKTCGADCTFGACEKKSGAACLYEDGTNWQCCGTDKWQFCNGSTCEWYPCQACPSGSSCQSAC